MGGDHRQDAGATRRNPHPNPLPVGEGEENAEASSP